MMLAGLKGMNNPYLPREERPLQLSSDIGYAGMAQADMWTSEAVVDVRIALFESVVSDTGKQPLYGKQVSNSVRLRLKAPQF
jgi:ABC-type uncharacterized transport system permease subunit